MHERLPRHRAPHPPSSPAPWTWVGAPRHPGPTREPSAGSRCPRQSRGRVALCGGRLRRTASLADAECSSTWLLAVLRAPASRSGAARLDTQSLRRRGLEKHRVGPGPRLRIPNSPNPNLRCAPPVEGPGARSKDQDRRGIRTQSDAASTATSPEPLRGTDETVVPTLAGGVAHASSSTRPR